MWVKKQIRFTLKSGSLNKKEDEEEEKRRVGSHRFTLKVSR